METSLILLFICLVCVTTADDRNAGLSITMNDQTPCGSWTPYTDAKCLRIADIATFQTKQEAEAVCPTFAETENMDDIPRLVTVKSEKEQQALKRFLFEEIGILDHVWLGVERGDDGVLRWNNELELHFNNLIEQNYSATNRQCVQMESGEGIYPMGQWVQVNCRKRNLVVCEKTQVWTIVKLQNNFLNFKSKVEQQIENIGIIQRNGIDGQVNVQTLQKHPGSTFQLTSASSSCGDWKPYKDQKCLKIATQAGHQTKEDAEIVCHSLYEGFNQESYPRLITVRTKEEQEFLQHFLFDENKILDNVWLGLKTIGSSAKYEWNDDTSVVYNNWAERIVVDHHNQCVQMASGEEFIAAGLWVRVNCKKVGVVVCERMQTWSLENLQVMFLNYKLDQERKLNEAITTLTIRHEASEKEIALLNTRNKESEKEIVDLKRNPVPLGFIYVQLPSQEPPSSLWSQTEWTDVSSSYAGLFFRVAGGQAAPFGQVQEANSSRLEEVDFKSRVMDGVSPLTIPPDGRWSRYIFSGANSVPMLHLRFRLSGGEVRPRNQAVKIWQRTY